jgi:Na+/H+ antiporter NhaC
MDGSSPVGWLCIVPPLLTIVLAIATKRVVLSLLAGIVAAIVILLPTPAAYATITAGQEDSGSWFGFVSTQLFKRLIQDSLWANLASTGNLLILLFTSILGIQVSLIHRSGGMLGIVNWAAPLARTRRGGQVLTWLLGLVVFIDDYANTLLLGSTMRPVTDRLKISREKLAFLVDSTAAPVSGLALVSTWVATEISSMQKGFEASGIDIGSKTFGVFLQTIPTRFYILYALVFVLLCAWMCRDFGPMLSAERRAFKQKDPPEPEVSSTGKPRPWNAIIPIVITVGVVLWWLAVTGKAALADEALPDSFLQKWGAIIGNGDSSYALVYGSLAGLAVVLVQIAAQRDLNLNAIGNASLKGFLHVLPALVILWLAWTLSDLTGSDPDVTNNLKTGAFLAENISQVDVSPALMPTIVFLLASAIAFSTGTSWGTMAILMPIVIPLVYELIKTSTGTAPAVDHSILTASIGSVLAGAIFGDHCSPISDTTILSSKSSGCDHIAHVRTQIPYALTIGAVAICLGTLPAGFGLSSYLLIPLGIAALALILLFLGRDATSEETI